MLTAAAVLLPDPSPFNIHLQPFPTLHFIFPSRSLTYIVYLLGFIFLAQFPRGSNKVLEGCFPLRVLVLVFVDRSRCILQIGPQPTTVRLHPTQLRHSAIPLHKLDMT